MKNVNEVLLEKTLELAQVRLQVDALRITAMLLADDKEAHRQEIPEGVQSV